MGYDDMITADKITLEKIQFGIQQMMSKSLMDNMRYESVEDIATNSFIKQLTFYLWGNKTNVEEYDTAKEYPATIWEELKRDFCPRWLKRKFPVRYSKDITHHKETHWHVCPHLEFNDNRKHLDFLMIDDVKPTARAIEAHKNKLEDVVRDYFSPPHLEGE